MNRCSDGKFLLHSSPVPFIGVEHCRYLLVSISFDKRKQADRAEAPAGTGQFYLNRTDHRTCKDAGQISLLVDKIGHIWNYRVKKGVREN